MTDAAPTIHLPGILDIVTANNYDGTVSVLIGNGNGTFNTPVTFPVGIGPDVVAVGDVNGDGFADIVTANFGFYDVATHSEHYGNNDVSVLLGNGSGGFTAASGSPVSVGANTHPFAVAVADLNGDGFGDIVVGNYSTSTVTVLKSNGNGTFTALTPVALPAGAGPSYVVTGDFNRDGKTDIITSNFGTGTVTVLLGDGLGGLTQKQTITVGSGPETIALGDINGDGITDMVVTNYNATNVSVLIGNGDGTFHAASTPTIGVAGAAFGVALGDVDGDGKLDMVVADFGSSSVTLFLGNGSGGFTAHSTPIPSSADIAAYSVSLADVNGDGILDMVLNAKSDVTGLGEVVVLLGTGNGNFESPASAAVYQVGGNPQYAAVVSLEPLTVNENASLVFSSAHGNAITVADVDGGSSSETVTLSVTHGTLTLGSTTGLTGLTGNGGASLSFSGTIAQLDAAMNGLTYTPTAHYHGSDAVKVTINDNTGVQPATSSAQELSVLGVNQAPAGTDNTIATLEDTAHTFAASDFGFTDPNDSPANNLLAVEITTLPAAGTLTDNGVAVTAGEFVSVTDVNAGRLVFTPAANVNGNGYAHFTFQVEDDGGTANGGVNLDQSPNTITINLTPVNDAPLTSGTTALALPNTVSALFSSHFDDSADNQPALPGGSTANTLAGIAITGDAANAATQGSWEYSTDGGTTWTSIASNVSATSALVLSSAAELRFVAVTGFSGTPGALTAHVIDNSTGNVSTTGVTGATLQGSSFSFTGIDVASHDGGSTPVSTGTASLTATVPGVTSIHLVDSSPTKGGSESFTVIFSEAVTGVDATDFALTATNAPGGNAISTDGISNISGSGTTYTVTVGGVTGDGTLRLDLNSGDSNITDSAGTAVSAGFTGGDAYTVDSTPPNVSSISPAGSNPSNAASDSFTVTFSETVTGVDSTDFTAVTSGSTTDTGITVTPVSGSLYTVTVNGVSGDGTLELDLNNSGTGIADLVGNAISGGFTGQAYTVDQTAPTPTSIVPTNSSPTNASSEVFTVTFSESVTGVDSSDFTAATSGTADTGITVTPVSGSVYSVTVNGVTGDGTLGLNLNSSGTGIADLAGNAISGGFTGQTYTVDQTAPNVTSIGPANSSPTNASSEAFTVTFSESVTGVDNTDFSAVTSGTADTGITVTPVSGSIYTVTVNGVTGDGTLGLDLNSSGTGIADLVGNAISSGFTGQTYTVDQTAPTVSSINLAGSSPNNASSEDFTVTFSESVNGVDSSDFSAVTGGTAADTGITVTPVSGSVYTVTVNGVTGDGTLGLNLNSSGTGITDLVGNAISGGFTGQTYTVVHSAPTVSSIGLANSSPNSGGSEVFTVTFSESVTGVDSTDFTAVITGSTTDTGITVTPVSGGVYTVTVNGVGGDGLVGLNLNSSGTGIVDLAGNAIAGGFTGPTYTVDNISPTVAAINRAGSSPNNASSEAFTVTFSESVTGVDNTDFTAVTTATAADTGITVTPVSGSVYTVTVDGVSGDGTLGLNLNSFGTGIADLAGNTIFGGFTGQIYTVDHTAPTVASIDLVGSTPNRAGIEAFTVTFSEGVIGVDASDFTAIATGTAADTGITVTPVSGSVYTVTVNGVTGDGTLGLNLNSSGTGIADLAGNAISGGFTGQTYTVDHATSDFNNNGTSDILLSMGSSFGEWEMQNGRYIAYQGIGVASGFTAIGTGDFSGGIASGLLLQDSGGSIIDWAIQNGQYAGYIGVGNPELSGFGVVEIGDFNGDGTSDILLENSAGALDDWIIKNGTYSSYNGVGNTSGYGLIGTGDFNGDGTADILLQQASGNLIDWTMKNGTYSGWNQISNPHTEGYGVVGTGDFNDDGTTDLLLENGSDNLIDWTMQNGQYASWSQIGNTSGYSVVGTGDYNGDGTSDILLQNTSGNVIDWIMKNGQFMGWNEVGNTGPFAVVNK